VLLLAPGGSIHSRRFLDWLQRAGCQVIFLDAARPANLNEASSRYLPWPRVNARRRWAKRLAGLQRYLFLRQVNAHFCPDITHIHYLDNRLYEAARAGLPRRVITCWGSDVNRHFQPGASPEAARRAGASLRRAAHVFADAADVLEKCVRLAGCALPSSLLLFGVDTGKFNPHSPGAADWRQELDIPAEALVVVSIRSFLPQYRQAEIVATFAAAREELDAPAYLLLKPYAADEGYLHAVQTQAEGTSVTPWLRWLEYIPDERMPGLYALADLVLNYPRQDAFPVSFMEAAASGALVVSNLLPAYTGWGLEDFSFFAAGEDLNAFTVEIRRALSISSETRSERRTLARRWALDYADERACLDKVMRTYADLMTPLSQRSKRP
jgi:hypothetical protein